MNGLAEAMRGLFGRGGDDAGCEESLEVLDLVVEAELSGRPVAEAFPAVAVHLDSCPDCGEDYEGLRALAGA